MDKKLEYTNLTKEERTRNRSEHTKLSTVFGRKSLDGKRIESAMNDRDSEAAICSKVYSNSQTLETAEKQKAREVARRAPASVNTNISPDVDLPSRQGFEPVICGHVA